MTTEAVKLPNYTRDTTLIQAFEDYLACRELRPSTRTDYRKRFKFISEWHDLHVCDLTAKMVRERHTDIKEMRGARQADLIFAVLRAVLNFANQLAYLEDDIEIKRNPVDILSALKLRQVTGTRIDDYIEDKDLGLWWLAVRRYQNRVISLYLQVLVLCGLRRTEAMTLKWDYVDLENGMLLVPASNTKNGHMHKIPLSNYLVDALRDWRSCSESQWVFPNRYSSHEHIQNPDKAIRRIADESGTSFTLHSLRRTFINIAANPEVQADEMTLKALLNHRARDVTFRHYVTVHHDRLRPIMNRIADFVIKKGDEASKKYDLSLARSQPTLIRALSYSIEDMPEHLLPANAKVQISPVEQVIVEAKILWCISEGCRRKKDFYSKIGASFKVNAVEMDRILKEMVERKLITAYQMTGAENWVYRLVKHNESGGNDAAQDVDDSSVEVEAIEI